LRDVLKGCETGREYWLPYPDHPSYYVSNLDRVRSPRKILKPQADGGSGKYLTVTINRKRRRVSHLVLETYIGECPLGEMACHWNGDKYDNALMNLRWAEDADNKADMIRQGRGWWQRRELDRV
jgi:hypothetical protein